MTSAKTFAINSQFSDTTSLSPGIESSSGAKSLRAKNANEKTKINQSQSRKSNFLPVNNRQNKSKKSRTNYNNNYQKLQSSNENDLANYPKVEQLKINNNPLWLKVLMSLNIISSCTTLLLITATLSLYGWTVYTQQSWGKAYRYLETLQRNERQLTATNEVIKNELALEAQDPNTGLINPEPNTTIFLNPTNNQLKSPQPSAVDDSKFLPNMPSNSNIPLGY